MRPQAALHDCRTSLFDAPFPRGRAAADECPGRSRPHVPAAMRRRAPVRNRQTNDGRRTFPHPRPHQSEKAEAALSVLAYNVLRAIKPRHRQSPSFSHGLLRAAFHQ